MSNVRTTYMLDYLIFSPMNRYSLIRFFILLFILINYSCVNRKITRRSRISEFINPVYNNDFPDPAIIRTSDNTFYAYATNGKYLNGEYGNIRVLKSKDLINWIECPDVLPVKAKWANKTDSYWAPFVIYANRKYYLYFSAEQNDKSGMGIGVAISDNPLGPFNPEDKPIVYGKSFENIDPTVYIDSTTNKVYLYWGSGFKPIKVQEMDGNLLTLKEGSRPQDIIFTSSKNYEILVEGPWIIHKNNYYYMFYSGDNCCGDKAHYAVLIARSKSPIGPFVTISEDTRCADNSILVENDYWLAPGHNSIIQDDNNDYWILYHAINRSKKAPIGEDKYTARELLIDKLIWESNGWPKKMTPSHFKTVVPYVR